MEDKTYSVVFSSRTGNTKMLAQALRTALPSEGCLYFGTAQDAGEDALSARTVYVGFWTDKGTADPATLAFLEGLYGKRVFLFGTAGFGGSDEYFAKILRSVEDAVAQGNTIAGSFICQGKMPETVRARYVKMQQDGSMPNADELIANFDRALAHPDQRDVEELRNAVARAAI